MIVNIKVNHYCGFCKYWYDPANSAISPHIANMNLWNMDKCEKICTKKNTRIQSVGYCPKYECKLEIL